MVIIYIMFSVYRLMHIMFIRVINITAYELMVLYCCVLKKLGRRDLSDCVVITDRKTNRTIRTSFILFPVLKV